MRHAAIVAISLVEQIETLNKKSTLPEVIFYSSIDEEYRIIVPIVTIDIGIAAFAIVIVAHSLQSQAPDRSKKHIYTQFVAQIVEHIVRNIAISLLLNIAVRIAYPYPLQQIAPAIGNLNIGTKSIYSRMVHAIPQIIRSRTHPIDDIGAMTGIKSCLCIEMRFHITQRNFGMLTMFRL